MHKYNLLIDADDTLWETNIQYERVADEFYQLISPLGFDAATVRDRLDQIERKNIKIRGYGMQSFMASLEETYEVLAGQQAGDGLADKIRALNRLFTPPRLIEGVAETLGYLSSRHRLHLFSKGNREEQAAKFDGSGLKSYFKGWDFVPEKTPEVYQEVAGRQGWKPEEVWMVGNSLKSDVNPALAAGMNAVFIPSAVSWSFENAEIQPGKGRYLQLEKFSELREHF